MPPRTMKARRKAPCPLCPWPVRKGQLIALDYDSGTWAHIGCWGKSVDEKRTKSNA